MRIYYLKQCCSQKCTHIVVIYSSSRYILRLDNSLVRIMSYIHAHINRFHRVRSMGTSLVRTKEGRWVTDDLVGNFSRGSELEQ